MFRLFIALSFRRIVPSWILALLLVVSGGCGQPAPDRLERELIGEVLMHSEFSANLRTLSVPGGRLSGTPGAERAEAFVADKLRAYGLSNVHFEPFDMSCWTVHETKVTLLGDTPRVLEGSIALGRTLSTPPEGVTAEVVDLGLGDDQAFAARANELPGRFALLRNPQSPRGPKAIRACEAGAAGVLIMSEADGPPGVGGAYEKPRSRPAVSIPYDAELLARLEARQPVSVNVFAKTENWNARPRNVVAELPGHGPWAKEVVILCAHLDSWHLGEGAIDNGTGSAVILETARALARSGWRPRRTVRFIWFMAEEQGLEGSEDYVRRHESELDNIVAVVNMDMPGEPRNFGVTPHAGVQRLLQELRKDLAGYDLGDQTIVWSPGASDHAPFLKRGVCTVRLGGERGPYVKMAYHTALDTYDKVDRQGTVHSAAVLTVLLRRLADAAERPAWRQTPTTGRGG